VHQRALNLSRVGDGHILPEQERLARDPMRALRAFERLRLLGDEGTLRVIRSSRRSMA